MPEGLVPGVLIGCPFDVHGATHHRPICYKSAPKRFPGSLDAGNEQQSDRDVTVPFMKKTLFKRTYPPVGLW